MADNEVRPGDREDHGRIGSRMALTLLLVLVAAVWSGATALERWWLPPVASVQGTQIDRLFTNIFSLTSVVFVLVHLTLVYVILRFRARGDHRAGHWHDNARLEATWTFITAAILVTFTVMSGVVWARLEGAAPPDALKVEVTAEQFQWRIRYPGPDGRFGRTAPELINFANPLGIDRADPAGKDDVVVLNDLRLPVDRPVEVFIRAKDVAHSFFVPHFRMKKDALPGRTNRIWFQPTEVGQYEIACAELCGVGHSFMRGTVTVMEEDQFTAWLDRASQDALARRVGKE